MSGKLVGRTAFVTGAGSGMGRAISIKFASEGANLVAVDVNEAAVRETVDILMRSGGKGVARAADVRDRDLVQQAVDAGLGEFGRLDILVNNAGIFGSPAPLLEMSDDLWNKVMGVNLHGAYIVTKAVLPHILAAGGGTIVNVASTASFVTGGGGVAYTTSKHGLLGFTRQLAVDYGPHGVRVNAVCPGAIDTNLTKPIWEDHPEALKTYSAVPAGRIGSAEDVANLALFLAGDDSAFMYGAGVVIDGGFLLT